jgi:hypothetical protein
MKIIKSKFPKKYMIGLGIIHVLEGLFMILTLGTYSTNYSLEYVLTHHKKLKQNNKLENH